MSACSHRMMVLAGDLGSAFRVLGLTEKDYRGSLFKDSYVPLLGNDEVLSLTDPDRVKSIQREFLEAGADLVVANSRNANAFCQSRFRLENMAYDMAKAAAAVACDAIKDYSQNLSLQGHFVQRKFVVGWVGAPLKIFEEKSFAECVKTFALQIGGLLDGGADILWIESVFNSVVGKAALYAALKECERRGELFPIMVTKKVTDERGLLLAPHAVKSMWYGLSSYPLFSVGVDCGESDGLDFSPVRELDEAHVRTSCLLNGSQLDSFFKECEQSNRLPLNIVGGVSGILPENVRQLSRWLRGTKPRNIPANEGCLRLCGLDPVEVRRDQDVVQISENLWSASLVENAGKITRVNLDETSMGLDMMKEIRGPILIQSRHWEKLVQAMGTLPGKGIASSISLRDGERMFLAKAKEIQRHGFAICCSPVDERGPALSGADQCSVFDRMYKLLVGQLELQPTEILFDPVVYTLGFGEDQYQIFADELRKIANFVKKNLPSAHVMGKKPC